MKLAQVLRTAGKTKRDNPDKAEAFLMYRTLRDMNLSKLVAQDVPLFLSLLADLFPSTPAPPKGEYPEIEAALKVCMQSKRGSQCRTELTAYVVSGADVLAHVIVSNVGSLAIRLGFVLEFHRLRKRNLGIRTHIVLILSLDESCIKRWYA